MNGKHIVARLLVAVAVGTAILAPASAASASPERNYIGPYETFELCETARQADPASVGKCVFLDDSTHPAGWYWRFNGPIGGCPPCPALSAERADFAVDAGRRFELLGTPIALI